VSRRELLRAEARSSAAGRRSRTAAALVCLGLSALAVAVGTSVVTAASLTAGAVTSASAALPAPTASGSSGSSAGGSVSAAVVPAPEAVALSDVAAPVSVAVPSLGISSPLLRLGVDADGALEVPRDADRAGWFEHGPAPGAVGPAVVVGHVDSREGPDVFATLRTVAVGAEVDVVREDGSTARFEVTRVQQVAKDAFPTEEVYGPAAGPELRLITCGGAFDSSTRHYVDNVVVYARLA
jgi:hypothetical protein